MQNATKIHTKYHLESGLSLITVVAPSTKTPKFREQILIPILIVRFVLDDELE